MSFSEQLKKARLAIGYTQQQVADAMGITNSTYCGYETGKRQPDVFKIKQLAAILKTSGDFLLETGFGDELRKEDIKTSPKPAATDPEDEKEKDEIVKVLTEGLSRLGFLDEEGMISDRDFKFLCSLVDLMFAHFNQED